MSSGGEFGTDGRAGELRGGFEDGTDGDVIEVRVGSGRFDLRKGVRGETDNHLGTDDVASFSEIAVVLAEVERASAESVREMRIVVDHEGRIEALSEGLSLPGADQYFAGFQVLFTKLHDLDASAQTGLDAIEMIGPFATWSTSGNEVDGGRSAEMLA